MPTTPRIWLAASGTAQGWRRADISLSLDSGASWQSIYTASGGSVLGASVTTRGEAGSALPGYRNRVDVGLAHACQWGRGRTEADSSEQRSVGGGGVATRGS